MTAPLGAALHALARAHRTRLGALLTVWAEPGLRQSALASRLGVEPATVTRMVQRLERSGLIERRRDQHDARVSRVHPTPRSRLLEPAVRRAWSQLDEMMVAELGENADALQALARAASTALGVSAT
jgi:DNA-binding MarR family transcriptional regulator